MIYTDGTPTVANAGVQSPAMDTYWRTDSRDFTEGQRVELHPSLDAWMSGDRFGTVVRTPGSARTMVRVRCDRSGRVRRVWAENLRHV